MAMTMNESPVLTHANAAPSALQADIYADVASGSGHTVVCARAGAGKTTTIMGALSSVPKGKTVALFAFNKSIKDELAARAPQGAEVKTLHAHGFAACRRAFKNVTLDDNKSLKICEAFWGPSDPDHAVRSRYHAVAKLVTMAKDTLVARGDIDALDALVDAFDIDCPNEPAQRDAFVRAAMRVLVRSSEVTHTVDYSDMCWLPVVLNLRVWAYDVVFVDETQDLSPTQIELVLMCVRRGGRIIAVGDSRQAIYAFRGADVNTIPNLISRLDAKVLPLSITYRCCRAVVALAQTEVPDFTAAPNAPEGSVTNGHTVDALLANAGPGDMVISRTNAPLMGLCLKLLIAGKRAAVKGRDVAEGLIKLVQKSKATTIAGLEAWLTVWHARETERLTRRQRPTTETDDKRDCILALCEGLATVAELLARCDALFVNGDNAEGSRITLGTTHKLKGLEADRVWMLESTYRRQKGGEEANVWYVAVTRAKTDLRMVVKADEKVAA